MLSSLLLSLVVAEAVVQVIVNLPRGALHEVDVAGLAAHCAAQVAGCRRVLSRSPPARSEAFPQNITENCDIEG
jgi:hypothetical protein